MYFGHFLLLCERDWTSVQLHCFKRIKFDVPRTKLDRVFRTNHGQRWTGAEVFKEALLFYPTARVENKDDHHTGIMNYQHDAKRKLYKWVFV